MCVYVSYLHSVHWEEGSLFLFLSLSVNKDVMTGSISLIDLHELLQDRVDLYTITVTKAQSAYRLPIGR
jgi:hypothetical protein